MYQTWHEAWLVPPEAVCKQSSSWGCDAQASYQDEAQRQLKSEATPCEVAVSKAARTDEANNAQLSGPAKVGQTLHGHVKQLTHLQQHD